MESLCLQLTAQSYKTRSFPLLLNTDEEKECKHPDTLTSLQYRMQVPRRWEKIPPTKFRWSLKPIDKEENRVRVEFLYRSQTGGVGWVV